MINKKDLIKIENDVINNNSEKVLKENKMSKYSTPHTFEQIKNFYNNDEYIRDLTGSIPCKYCNQRAWFKTNLYKVAREYNCPHCNQININKDFEECKSIRESIWRKEQDKKSYLYGVNNSVMSE